MAEETQGAKATKAPALFPGVLLRGMLMGAADIVPGVSGGTMAFITGIYHRLLSAISAFDLRLLRMLRQGRWAQAWEHVDAPFLLTLLSGIALSIFSLARVISHFLESAPLLIWSFFFGLILASALLLTRHVAKWTPWALIGLLCGTLIAAVIGVSPAAALPAVPLSFFLAGCVAICAMILPGVSGSFILVLLGMYPAVLAAIETLDWFSLLLFAAGAACGLLVFSRVLNFLLERFHSSTLATLTGFLFGSLLVVWPWKLAGAGDAPERPVWPQHYAEVLGDSQLLVCLALMFVGSLAVWLLESRWGGLEH
jgi:putative membrane protein